jgi:hypothetical protein
VFLAVLVLLLGGGCKKSSSPTYYAVPDDLKQWYLYQKGSYWVYTNNQSSKIDCTFLSKDPKYWDEYFFLDDKSVGAITQHIDSYYESPLFQICNIVHYQVNLATSYSYINYVYINNIREGEQWKEDEYHTFEYIGFYDTIQIQDNIYNNVRETKYEFLTSNMQDTYSLTTFFAKNIGVIRITKKFGSVDTTWNILRYNVKQ